MSDIRFLVGVDGGGTNCRAALATIERKIIGRGEAGSSNITTDLDGATANILAAIGDAFKAAGLPDEAQRATCAWLGLAGANVGPFAGLLTARLPFARKKVDGDAPIALQGALHEGDGAIAILGTGSAFLSRKGDTFKLIGGWGFNLSDLGGGARLGRDALQLSLLAHDGMRPKTPLTEAIMNEFSGNPDNLVLYAKTAKPVDFGRFAPFVVRYAEGGDTAAKTLLAEQASFVDAAFDVLCDDQVHQIALLGGLAPHMPPYLAERHRRRLVAPRADALTGAVELAGKLARGEEARSVGR